jgi:hypothetical protein
MQIYFKIEKSFYKAGIKLEVIKILLLVKAMEASDNDWFTISIDW